MAEMNAAFFEEAKYNLQHGKINFLNVAYRLRFQLLIQSQSYQQLLLR